VARRKKSQWWRSKVLTATPEVMEKALSGKRNRAKGLAFERQVAIWLRDIFPGARRWLENHKDDANGIDLQGTGCFRFQVKKLKGYCSVATINEIKCEPELGDVPVLVTAGDNLPAMAVLPLKDFLWLLRESGYTP